MCEKGERKIPGGSPPEREGTSFIVCFRQPCKNGCHRELRGPTGAGGPEALEKLIAQGSLDARDVLSAYCKLLHKRLGSYEEVARVTRLDWRTVKKYVSQA
jgi:hypothetical protein